MSRLARRTRPDMYCKATDRLCSVQILYTADIKNEAHQCYLPSIASTFPKTAPHQSTGCMWYCSSATFTSMELSCNITQTVGKCGAVLKERSHVWPIQYNLFIGVIASKQDIVGAQYSTSPLNSAEGVCGHFSLFLGSVVVLVVFTLFYWEERIQLSLNIQY